MLRSRTLAIVLLAMFLLGIAWHFVIGNSRETSLGQSRSLRAADIVVLEREPDPGDRSDPIVTRSLPEENPTHQPTMPPKTMLCVDANTDDPVRDVCVFADGKCLARSDDKGLARIHDVGRDQAVAIHELYIPEPINLQELPEGATVRLTKGSSLSGWVLDGDSQPLDNVQVFVSFGGPEFNVADKQPTAVIAEAVAHSGKARTYVRTARTDKMGRFEMQGLLLGGHEVRLRRFGYMMDSVGPALEFSVDGSEQTFRMSRIFCAAARVVSSCPHQRPHGRGDFTTVMQAPSQFQSGIGPLRHRELLDHIALFRKSWNLGDMSVVQVALAAPGGGIATSKVTVPVQILSVTRASVSAQIEFVPLDVFREEDIQRIELFRECPGHSVLRVKSQHPIYVMGHTKGIYRSAVRTFVRDGDYARYEVVSGNYRIEPETMILPAKERIVNVALAAGETRSIDYSQYEQERGSLTVNIVDSAGQPTSNYRINVTDSADRLCALIGEFFGPSCRRHCHFGKYTLHLFDAAGSLRTTQVVDVASDSPDVSITMKLSSDK